MQFEGIPDFNQLFQWNVKPVDDFEGFTPNEIHGLLYNPFVESDSPLRVNRSINPELLAKVPFYHDTLRYLEMLGDHQPLKLTPKGYLPRNFCRELYDMGVKDEELMMLKSHQINVELDSLYIFALNAFTGMLGLTKIRYNRISLTKKGIAKLKKPDSSSFFFEIFEGYTKRFNWGYTDGHSGSWIIQAGFGLSIYMVQKYGNDFRPVDFYADKYLKAFPMATYDYPATDYAPPEKLFKNAYSLRVFERFLKRFGFIEITGDKIGGHDYAIKKTPVIDEIISWKMAGDPGPISGLN